MGTMIIPRVGARMRQALMASVAAPDVLKLLEEVAKPSDELAKIIEELDKMVKATPVDGAPPTNLEGIYKSLKKVKDKDKPVLAAIKLLDKVYGKPSGKSPAPDLGNLPFFELLRSAPTAKPSEAAPETRPALQAAFGKGPGYYVARLIRAGEALDKKKWKEDALQAAVSKGLFEGAPLKVFSYAGEYGPVEYHLPLTDSDFAGVTVGNQVGFVTNATWDDKEKAVFGELVITDPQRQALIDAMIDKQVSLPGLSIYCEGDMDDNMEVNDISRIHSMDLVTWPAADGAILGVQALQASWLGFLGAANEPPAQGEAQSQAAPVEGAEPMASESVTETSWKSERNIQLDFFTSMANFARETIEAGGEIVPDGVAQVYDKWTAAWEGSQDETFEAFMSDFWGNPENAGALKKQEQMQEQQQDGEQSNAGQQTPPRPATQGQGAQQSAQQPLNLAPKRQVGASKPGRAGGAVLMVNGREVKQINDRVGRIEQRINIVDTEAMIDRKLAASGLPADVQEAIRTDVYGRTISASAVDGLIDSHRRAISSLEAGLAQEAAITIDGQPLGGGSNAQEAMSIILNRK